MSDPAEREVSVREAVEADLPWLTDLWLDMMEEHSRFEPRFQLTRLASASYQSYLLLHARSAKSIVALAEGDAGICGFCCAYVCRNLPMFEPAEFGYISDLYVAPDSRHRGLGTRLLDFATERLRSHGIDCMQLQVYDKNAQGKAFWASKGYEPYFGRMWLNLRTPSD